MKHAQKTHKKSDHKAKRHHTEAFDKALLAWRAPEYTHHEKSTFWFLVAGVIAFLLVLYGLRTEGGWTFSIAIIVFAGSYYLFYRSSPPIVEVKISKIGIKIGKHTFPMNNIRNFWITYNPPFVMRLYLRMTSKFHPDIAVSLDNADPAEVHQILSSFVKELKGKGEPFSDTLARLFRL